MIIENVGMGSSEDLSQVRRVDRGSALQNS